MLPKISAYVKGYEGEESSMKFLIKDDDLLKKYNDIWNKVSYSIQQKLNCKPIYNKKVLETKIRSYSDEATDFHARKISETGSCIYVG